MMLSHRLALATAASLHQSMPAGRRGRSMQPPRDMLMPGRVDRIVCRAASGFIRRFTGRSTVPHKAAARWRSAMSTLVAAQAASMCARYRAWPPEAIAERAHALLRQSRPSASPHHQGRWTHALSFAEGSLSRVDVVSSLRLPTNIAVYFTCLC